MAIRTNAAEARRAAKKSRKFSKKVAKTSHQWEADDLERAGLNRILSLTGTGGGIGPTPAAPFGVSSAQELSTLTGAAGTATSAGRQASMAKADLATAKSQSQTAASEAEIRNTERTTAKETQALLVQQRVTSAALEAKTAAETSILGAKTPRVQAQEWVFDKVLRGLQHTGKSFQKVFDVMRDPKSKGIFGRDLRKFIDSNPATGNPRPRP